MVGDDVLDALVIGGGFYGCAIALYLRRRGLPRVRVVEREAALFCRASYANQARVHSGYHYPRSFVTAYRSRVNFRRFSREFAFAVRSNFVNLYAIPAQRSAVSPVQFEHFMRDIGAPFTRASAAQQALFSRRLIAAVYVTEEHTFDADRLRAHYVEELRSSGIRVSVRTELQALAPAGEIIEASLMTDGGLEQARARLVFNCAYARLNHNVRGQGGELTALKHELAEVALVEPPPELQGIGVTLTDGPFFSCMPFPAAGCHSLTHVRYTPHAQFVDAGGDRDPDELLSRPPPQSRAPFMIADAARYMPCLRRTRHVRSLFELKTMLVRNEADDGRPILFRRDSLHPRLFSVLGAKIDNIYDILARIDSVLQPPANAEAARALTCL